MSRRQMGLTGAGLAVLALLMFWALRPEPTAEEQIRTQIETFVEGVETRKPSRSTSILTETFEWDGFDREDVAQGLIYMARQYHDVKVHMRDPQIEVAEDGEHATVWIECSLTGFIQNRAISVGEDQPLLAVIEFEKVGRHWKAVTGRADARLAEFAYP